jgi:hypothetical protein
MFAYRLMRHQLERAVGQYPTGEGEMCASVFRTDIGERE